MSTARIVTCPACQGPSVYAPDNAYRPFCSRRCKEHDFGAWANEEHRLPQAPSSDELDPDQDLERDLGAASDRGLGTGVRPALGVNWVGPLGPLGPLDPLGLGAEGLPPLLGGSEESEGSEGAEPPPKRLQ